jgi:hypothetical protein
MRAHEIFAKPTAEEPAEQSVLRLYSHRSSLPPHAFRRGNMGARDASLLERMKPFNAIAVRQFS